MYMYVRVGLDKKPAAGAVIKHALVPFGPQSCGKRAWNQQCLQADVLDNGRADYHTNLLPLPLVCFKTSCSLA
jgi:hypothetical protein